MPSGAERMPTRGSVMTRVGRSGVVNDTVELIAARRRFDARTSVSRHIQIRQREINAGVQLAESLAGTEAF